MAPDSPLGVDFGTRLPRAFVLLCSLVMCTALRGCQAPQPAIDAERAIASSLEISERITFQTEGGPIDEPPEASATLTLSEAMNRAVTTDPSIQSALARVRMALADAQQSRLWPNPILNLALRWPEGGGSPIVEASLAQDFIAILMVPRRSSAADNRLRETASDAMTVALDVATELQERYATVQALDELVPLLEQRREPLDKLVELANRLVQAGEGTQQDVTVLEAQRVELAVEIASTELDRRDQRLQLARLIGEPSSNADWTLDAWQAPRLAQAPESAWINAALRHRPEIQSIMWRLAALNDDLALTQLLKWEGGSAGAQAERDGDWSIGPELSLPLPIFDMGQARAARVTAEQIEARHEMTKAQRSVVEAVRRAYESLNRTEANLQRVSNELLPLQQQRRAQAEALFRAGQDVTGLFLAEQDLRAAEAQEVDLERQASIALIRLQRAVGGAGVARQITTP